MGWNASFPVGWTPAGGFCPINCLCPQETGIVLSKDVAFFSVPQAAWEDTSMLESFKSFSKILIQSPRIQAFLTMD